MSENINAGDIPADFGKDDWANVARCAIFGELTAGDMEGFSDDEFQVKENQCVLMRHDTAESVCEKFWSGAMEAAGLDCSEWRDGNVGGFDESGNEVDCGSMDEIIEGIRQTGLWGFYETSTQTVHVYYEPAVAGIPYLIHFLAHELAHHAVNQKHQGEVREELREEFLCEEAGAIAAISYQWAMSLQAE